MNSPIKSIWSAKVPLVSYFTADTIVSELKARLNVT